MEPVTGLFVTALFKATETIWSKSFDAAWSPVDASLKSRFTRWAGKDQEQARSAAFAHAIASARERTITASADPKHAETVLSVLNNKLDPQVVTQIADECAKLLLFAETPDLDYLAEVCDRALRFEALVAGTSAPSADDVAAVLADFVTNLRAALLDQQPYQELVHKEMLRTLQSILDELRAPAYDDETTYREQVAKHYSRLDFVGIPEIKDQQPITVKDLFIRLRAQREAAIPASKESLSSVHESPQMPVNREVVREEVTLTEALRSGEAFVVLGDPGGGKTTLLKYVTVICAEGRGQSELGLSAPDGSSLLPIFVSLRLFAAEIASRDADYSLLDFLCTTAYERLESRLSRTFFEQALAAGRCLLCLDGLDEVWAVGQRVHVRDAVQSLISRFPRNRYIVTSRLVGYDDAPLDRRDFVHHIVLSLTDSDIHEFVRKWYDQREPDPVQRKQQVDDLIGTIQRETRIQTLARNPLLLTIIALVHRIEAELPNERVKLYDKCVGALLETWENVKQLTIEEKQRPFYRYRRWLLERLAYELHTRAEQTGEVRTIKAGDLEVLLARFLMQKKQLDLADDLDAARDEAQAFIRLARSRTGLLIERGDGEFGFPHLTFQEYLAACDIEKRSMQGGTDAIWAAIKERLHDPHWREAILLLLGSLNKYDEFPTVLVEQILAAGATDLFEPVLHRHLLLAARTLADRVDVAANVRRRIVDDLIAIVAPAVTRGYESSKEAIRLIMGVERDALEVLRALRGDTYASEQLDALVRNPALNGIVRAAAASALANISSSAQTVATLALIAHDPELDQALRAKLARVLAHRGQLQTATSILLEIGINSGSSSWDQLFVAATLEQLERQDDAIAVYHNMLTCAEWADDNQVQAAEALIRLGRVDLAAPELLDLLDTFMAEDEGRSHVARTLQEIGYEADAAEILLELAQNTQEAPYDRIDAAIALGEVGQTEVAAQLLLTLAGDPDVRIDDRSDAAWGLFELDHFDEAAAIWLKLIADRTFDSNMLSGAVQALEHLGRHTEATALLTDLARDPLLSLEDRASVADALRHHHRADLAADLYTDLMQDDALDRRGRVVAAQKLVSINGASEAIALLLGVILDESVEVPVKQNAVRSLAQIKHADQPLIHELLALVQRPTTDSSLRSAVAQTLGKLGQAEAVTMVLLDVARDTTHSAQTRISALKAIAELGPNQAAAELLMAIGDNDSGLYHTLKRLVEGAA